MSVLRSLAFRLVLVTLASGVLAVLAGGALSISASAQLIPRENVVITPVGPTIRKGDLQYQDFTVSVLPEGLEPDARLTDFTVQATRFGADTDTSSWKVPPGWRVQLDNATGRAFYEAISPQNGIAPGGQLAGFRVTVVSVVDPRIPIALVLRDPISSDLLRDLPPAGAPVPTGPSQTTKQSDKRIVENITKEKTVTIRMTGEFTLKSVNESQNLTSQTTSSNTALDGITEDLSGVLLGSFDNAAGIILANQDTGRLANLGNALSFGETVLPGSPEEALIGLADASVTAQQSVFSNNIDPSLDLGDTVVTLGPDTAASVTALIQGSGSGNAGITIVNQNVGRLNNLTNSLAMAVLQASGGALSDADLAQTVSSNQSMTAGGSRSGKIDASFNDGAGLYGVNQAAGDLSNLANVVSFAGAASFAQPIGGGVSD
ncbi:MAG: hypothetical protein ACOY3L_02395 [Pseudomonadota bacterium]